MKKRIIIVLALVLGISPCLHAQEGQSWWQNWKIWSVLGGATVAALGYWWYSKSRRSALPTKKDDQGLPQSPLNRDEYSLAVGSHLKMRAGKEEIPDVLKKGCSEDTLTLQLVKYENIPDLQVWISTRKSIEEAQALASKMTWKYETDYRKRGIITHVWINNYHEKEFKIVDNNGDELLVKDNALIVIGENVHWKTWRWNQKRMGSEFPTGSSLDDASKWWGIEAHELRSLYYVDATSAEQVTDLIITSGIFNKVGISPRMFEHFPQEIFKERFKNVVRIWCVTTPQGILIYNCLVNKGNKVAALITLVPQ